MGRRTLAGPGPSPRVRGSPVESDGTDVSGGSIPACAGKPVARVVMTPVARVHPRVCGEALAGDGNLRRLRGPSPRVRGSLETRGWTWRATTPPSFRAGFPAHAEMDLYYAICDVGGPRLPRTRGDGPRAGWPPPCCSRASPHTRGWTLGAGKPRPNDPPWKPRGVHPRVCGEASGQPAKTTARTGPSPRVRGSLPQTPSDMVLQRSIPACAGKPWSRTTGETCRRVHPRVCGEAFRRRRRRPASWGPSPRVRGSPGDSQLPRRGRGSIPACAGKPDALIRCPTVSKVHPRVCGEAAPLTKPLALYGGPSPRVRGSPPDLRGIAGEGGSIPACAGKPTAHSYRTASTRVHPRVCGEAWWTAVALTAIMGPSPRVRGSLCRSFPVRPSTWSIPACAGKPRGPTRRL